MYIEYSKKTQFKANVINNSNFFLTDKAPDKTSDLVTYKLDETCFTILLMVPGKTGAWEYKEKLTMLPPGKSNRK